MKNRFVVAGCLCITILVLACFTPALALKPLTPMMNTVSVEMTHYTGINQKMTVMTVSSANARQIERCLIDLNNAQQRNDRAAIEHCITILTNKGITISPQERSLLFPQPIIQYLRKPGFHSSLADNITNQACFFTATGQGILLGTFFLMVTFGIPALIRHQSSPLIAFILLILLFPLFIAAGRINNVIPFRILMPLGSLGLSNGMVFDVGLQGVKRMTVNATEIGVNLSWFTGITIHVPPLNASGWPFEFVSGFAAKVEGPIY
jgi:hypothetical protein